MQCCVGITSHLHDSVLVVSLVDGPGHSAGKRLQLAAGAGCHECARLLCRKEEEGRASTAEQVQCKGVRHDTISREAAAASAQASM